MHASARAKKEQIRNQPMVLAEMRPKVLVSDICPIARVMEVNTENIKNRSRMRKRFLTALVFACALMYVLAIGIIVLRFGYNPRHLSGLSYAIIAIGSAAILVSLLVYFIYSRRGLVFNLKEFTAVFVCMSIGYTLSLCLSLVSLYLMPIAVTAFLISPIARRRDAFVCSLTCIILLMSVLLVGVHGGADRIQLVDVLPMFLMGILTGSLAAYSVSTDTKRLSYVLKGIVIGIIGAAALFVCFAIRNAFKEFVKALPYMSIAIVVQVLTGLLLQPIIEKTFNLVTNSQIGRAHV